MENLTRLSATYAPPSSVLARHIWALLAHLGLNKGALVARTGAFVERLKSQRAHAARRVCAREWDELGGESSFSQQFVARYRRAHRRDRRKVGRIRLQWRAANANQKQGTSIQHGVYYRAIVKMPAEPPRIWETVVSPAAPWTSATNCSEVATRAALQVSVARSLGEL